MYSNILPKFSLSFNRGRELTKEKTDANRQKQG